MTQTAMPSVRFISPAVLPGTDLIGQTAALEAELEVPHASTIAELPARGHYSTALGRAVAQLQELHGELTSYGWRLTSRPGLDQQRAVQGLRGDIDAVADIRGDRISAGSATADLSFRALGPLSAAAGIALPSGEKALIDHGARRDLGDSLAAGVRETMRHLRRSCEPERLHLIIEEPQYAAVLGGSVPTVSGYRSIRAIPREEARTLITSLITAAREGGADEVYLDPGGPLTATLIEDHAGPRSAGSQTAEGAETIDGFVLDRLDADYRHWELVGAQAEAGLQFLLPVLQPAETAGMPEQGFPEVTQITARVTRPWQGIGMSLRSLGSLSLTTHGLHHREGLRQATPAQAMATITRVRDAAEALTEQLNQ